jgi:hypothetical protein
MCIRRVGGLGRIEWGLAGLEGGVRGFFRGG